MIGAGIFRSGFVTNGSAIEWSRVARIGLGVGLPLSLATTWLTQRELLESWTGGGRISCTR